MRSVRRGAAVSTVAPPSLRLGESFKKAQVRRKKRLSQEHSFAEIRKLRRSIGQGPEPRYFYTKSLRSEQMSSLPIARLRQEDVASCLKRSCDLSASKLSSIVVDRI